MDLTWCTERTAAGTKCVMVMTDYETNEAWMRSLKKKDEVIKQLYEKISRLKDHEIEKTNQ